MLQMETFFFSALAFMYLQYIKAPFMFIFRQTYTIDWGNYGAKKIESFVFAIYSAVQRVALMYSRMQSSYKSSF
jgi:hypothetical protein